MLEIFDEFNVGSLWFTVFVDGTIEIYCEEGKSETFNLDCEEAKEVSQFLCSCMARLQKKNREEKDD